MIGISAIDGQGRRFSAGGRVVKNVAGYDLCKLLTGSMGTLGVITQLSLKLRPMYESRTVVCLELDGCPAAETQLQGLLQSDTRPVAIELLNSKALRQVTNESRVSLQLERPMLCVAFEGTSANVAWQSSTLANEMGVQAPVVLSEDQADRFWTALTDYQSASDDPLTFQASLPASAVTRLMMLGTELGLALQAHAGNGIVIGHLPDRCTTAEQALELLNPIRAEVKACGGTLSVLACDDAWKSAIPVIDPMPSSSQLMRRVKEALDPRGILSPGRIHWPAE